MPNDDEQRDVVLKSFGYSLVGDLLLVYHTSDSPADDEWACWLEYSGRARSRGVLVLSDGGAPNSAQRARAAKAISELGTAPPPLVLLTDSSLVRGTMTAISWLMPRRHRMKALPCSALEEALAWLGVEVTAQRVHEAIGRLQFGLVRGVAARSRR